MIAMIASLGRCANNYLLELFNSSGYYAVQEHQDGSRIWDEDKFANSSKSALLTHSRNWLPKTKIDKVIFLSRRDKLAHAFSFAVVDYLMDLNIEDEIVSVWHPDKLPVNKLPKIKANSNYLVTNMMKIERQNDEWRAWLDQNKLEYIDLYYEDLFSQETQDLLGEQFGITNFQPHTTGSKKNPIQAKDIFENYEQVVWNFKQGYINQ